MRRLVAIVVLALAAPAFPHGASRGLHLHVTPESAAPGAEVEVAVDAATPIVLLRIGFVGEKPTELRPKGPSRHLVVKLRVPAQAHADSMNVHAEADAGASKPLRASAVVKVSRASVR